MICAHCKGRGVNVAHVKACSGHEQGIRIVGRTTCDNAEVEHPGFPCNHPVFENDEKVAALVTEAFAPYEPAEEVFEAARTFGFAPASQDVKPGPMPVTEAGVYFDGERYFKVVFNKRRTHLYAKVWDAEWVYAPGAMNRLTADMRVSAEQAAKFGKLWGSCVFCTRLLTDERSVSVGYGPVCADKNGLPWGAAPEEAQSA